MSLTGPDPETPTKVGVPVGDLLARLHAVYGILAALHARHRTGRGEVVRTSLLSALVGVHSYQGTRYTVGGAVPRAQGNHPPSIAPYGAFACANGMLQIAVANDTLWRRTASVADVNAEDPRFATNGERVRNQQDLVALLEDAFADRTRDELLSALADAGVPSGAIRTPGRGLQLRTGALAGTRARPGPPHPRPDVPARTAGPFRYRQPPRPRAATDAGPR